MNIHFETPRLIIRDFDALDIQGIFELDSDPEVLKYLGKRPINSIEEAEEIVKSIRNQYTQNGVGRWAVIDKTSNEFIGWTGLKHEKVLRPEFTYYDLGYRLKKQYWGQGIATETSMLSLNYGFTKLSLSEICAAADVNHAASNKVLSRVGLKSLGTFDHNGVTHNWYKITKAEWMALKTAVKEV